MPATTRRAVALLVGALAAGGALAACGSAAGPEDLPEGSTLTPVSSVEAAGIPRALLADPVWRLREASDLPAGSLIAHVAPVPLAWYAEYSRLLPERDGVTVELGVMLSGDQISVEGYRAVLADLGVDLRPVDTPMGPGWAGSTGARTSGPHVVAVALGHGTLELLSYDLPTDELVALLADVHVVDDASWQAAVAAGR